MSKARSAPEKRFIEVNEECVSPRLFKIFEENRKHPETCDTRDVLSAVAKVEFADEKHNQWKHQRNSRDINELFCTTRQLKSEVEMLTGEIEGIKDDVESLKDDVLGEERGRATDIVILQERVQNLEIDLSNHVCELQMQIMDCSQKIVEHSEKIDSVKSTLEDLLELVRHDRENVREGPILNMSDVLSEITAPSVDECRPSKRRLEAANP